MLAVVIGSLSLAVGAAVAQKTQSRSETRGPSPEPFVHESWTVEDGLPVNSINALLQSRDGYLWIGTFDGLVRFDGVRFTVFNSANSEGLPSNRIIEVREVRDGSLWLRTEQFQLVRFRAGVFTHVGADRGLAQGATALYEDRGGTLWVGTDSGLGVIRDERFVPVAANTIRGRVQAIIQRADRTLWVGTAPSGLFRIDGDTVSSVAGPGELASRDVTALYEDPGGTLWVGSTTSVFRYDNGLRRVMPETLDVMHFRTSPRSAGLWILARSAVFRLDAGVPVRIENRVDPPGNPELLFPDADGLMLSTTGPELHREGRRIYSLATDTAVIRAGPMTITAAAFDHEGSLWLGTRAGGLHRLKPALFRVYGEAEGLSDRNVYAVYADRSDRIWIGSLNGGTNKLERGRVMHMGSGHPPTVTTFLQDRTGQLWVGGGNGYGIRVCSPSGDRCAPPRSDPIRRSRVSAIHEEPTGALWFGTDAGVFRLDAGRWNRFTESDSAPAYPVRVFQRTVDSALWMGTNGGGVARYRDGKFTRLTHAEGLPSDLVRSLYADADGWLWVGTEGRGLVRLDPREWGEGRRVGRIVSYRAKDGLFDEVIHQILEDDTGRLWMSTNRGIFWVDRRELNDFADGRTTRIHSTGYTERDGLRNREANGGSQPAGAKSRDGRLWFPTQDGVAVVDPARIQRNRIAPIVAIEQVIAGDAALRPGSERLELGSAQRDLEIHYTALSFLAPANMRFRYRLEPYDAAWVDAGNRRTAFYTKVPPGRYTFRVRASNNDGVWNERGAAVELRIAPHVWETGAFRLLALLTVGLLLAGGVGWRVRGLRVRTRELGRLVDERTSELREHKQQLEAQTEQLKELDRAKSRFFANVSHEFRTPLTLTIGPLEDLRARLGGAAGESPRELEMALRNSRRLLRLVNQILDVAKLEAGQMKLRARRQDLVTFARGVASAFAQIAEQKRIGFEVTASPAEIPVWFDPDALEKVLANLLSNAFKFTPIGGRIRLAIEAEPVAKETGVARLRVSDTGPGIPVDQVPHVFERFYQVDESSTRAQLGTGIGLALAKELVELHGGIIGVENGEGDVQAGATFTVTLPLGHAHLRDDQIVALQETVDVTEGEPPSVPMATDGAQDGDGPRAGSGEDLTTLLVVDDSADLRTYVRAHFERRYRVVEAADGTEGIEQARAIIPDLVISDVMMPGMDGSALCRALRNSPETDFIPIILLTARTSTDDRVAGFVGGADDYLAKPFEMRELEARVENLIASRRRLRERFVREPFAGEWPEMPSTPRQSALSPSDQAFVDRMFATIAAQMAEPEFGVAELARQLFLDRSHLFRRTRELVGEPPSDLIRRLRMQRAAQLLGEGAGSVAEVAYGVGFQSVSHFSQCFRDAHGVSPSEYRVRVAARS